MNKVYTGNKVVRTQLRLGYFVYVLPQWIVAVVLYNDSIMPIIQTPMLPVASPHQTDPWQKYKRQTYLLTFPMGIVLGGFYAIEMAGEGDLRFPIALLMLVQLTISAWLIWRVPRLIPTVELMFYFSIGASFLLAAQLALSNFIAEGSFNVESLGDVLNSLTMWMIVFEFGAFLTLKPIYTKIFSGFLFTSMVLMTIQNLVFVFANEANRFPFVFRWFNPLGCLALMTLLIQRMGVVQQRNASTDALTGVMNRYALYQVLGQLWESKQSFSLILFDLDHFKRINDTFGHLVGDGVLATTARRVEETVRAVDHVGRWGGEEFLLVLPEMGLEAAQALAENLREMIESECFEKADCVTASFGVTIFQQGRNLVELLNCADNALYEAKHSGRNRVVVLSCEMEEVKVSSAQ